MTTITELSPASSLSFFGPIGRAFAAMHRKLAMRRAEQHLMELPDYMLKDLGISRCEIGPFVAGESQRHPYMQD